MCTLHLNEKTIQTAMTQELWCILAYFPAAYYMREFQKLATVMLLISVSSVQAKHGLSGVTHVKGALHSCLQERPLDAALQIFYSCFTVKIPPSTRAMQLFLAAKERPGVSAMQDHREKCYVVQW